jgi:hypothetical protein
LRSRGHIYGDILVKLLHLDNTTSKSMIDLVLKEWRKYMDFVEGTIRAKDVGIKSMMKLTGIVSYIKNSYKDVRLRMSFNNFL